ncbi:MAG: regulatory iron-sulfur-containing complex subunit RicT [Spirochaeta sp.]|jgi:cell fate regulator YaaT (PSP1 superfamily)|nr:regulatory iron-sulfur-containing complex subunit RicT [Spirochaeta sp.]
MQVVLRNLHSRETDLGDTGALEVRDGDTVVYSGRYGLDLGEVLTGDVSDQTRKQYKQEYSIERIAGQGDLDRYYSQEREAHSAVRTCSKRVDEHRLEMRVVSAHYLLDRSKMLVFFVSEHRVDFRNLVRDLVSEFQLRVELRQIGVRDETRILGGLGICGRRLCCNGVSDHLAPVSIRMAKDQNYSLNSMKVSGPCGRLLCCLAYEHGFYQEERRRYPREGALVELDGDTYRVQEINILSGQIRMFGPEGQYASLPICAFQRQGSRQQDKQQQRGGGGNRRKSIDWVISSENCPAARTAVDTE